MNAVTDNFVGRSPTSRSRTTNRAAHLCAVDGRSSRARRFRDLAASIISDLGGNGFISEAQRQLARRAAALSLQCELLEADMAKDKQLNADEYVKLVNALARTFSSIGIERRRRNATPDLNDYIAAKGGSAQ